MGLDLGQGVELVVLGELAEAGVTGMIIGRALYEAGISLPEAIAATGVK